MTPQKAKFAQKQMSKVLKLEQLFHNKYLTPDFLHELVALYVQAIQVFNNQFLFMRGYFLQKMQFVLSRPQIVSMLGNDQNAMNGLRDTLRVTDRDENDFKFHQQEAPKVQQRVENHEHHHYHYDENKSKQRNMKIDMKVKVMREVEQNMRLLKEEVNEQEKKLQKKQMEVKDITKNQQNQLEMRRAMRKKKMRRKSIQIKPKVLEGQQQEPQIPIKKEELIEVQRELTERVLKMTVRITERAKQEQNKKRQPTKGRVKLRKMESISDVDQQQDKNDERNKNNGRIKTKRVEEEENSQYW